MVKLKHIIFLVDVKYLINSETKIVGLFGHPIEHSLSPNMHNTAFKDLNLNYVYVTFNVEPENLKTALMGAKSMGVIGLNITIPHKVKIINYLDYIDESASLIGAVNTIHFKDNLIQGYNTDGKGALRALENITSVKNKKITILGAGGAARAVVCELLLADVDSVNIINRDLNKAEVLKKNILSNIDVNINVDKYDNLKNIISETDILIDSTPVGMYPNNNAKPLVTSDMMHSDLIVNHLVYNPLETSILREAKKAEAIPISGLDMLIYQGIESFKIWTGEEAPYDLLKETLLKILL